MAYFRAAKSKIFLSSLLILERESVPRCWPHIATRGHVNTRALVSHTRQSDAASSPGETSFTTVVERVADTTCLADFFPFVRGT